jgi:hypothetical protein
VSGAKDLAHAFGLRIQCGVTQDPAREDSNLVLPDSETDDAVVARTVLRVEESKIACEKRHASHAAEKRNDLLVMHSGSPYVISDLPDANTPAA